VDKAQLIKDVRYALYASKLCSYAQGFNLMKSASKQFEWNVNLAECARIFTGGCIIRARYLSVFVLQTKPCFYLYGFA
jgi:6-phosphogluconate dehydrogenase